MKPDSLPNIAQEFLYVEKVLAERMNTLRAVTLVLNQIVNEGYRAEDGSSQRRVTHAATHFYLAKQQGLHIQGVIANFLLMLEAISPGVIAEIKQENEQQQKGLSKNEGS